MLRLFDSLDKKQKPLDERELSIYVCGPTVYDDPHVGHGRVMIVFDVLRRVLMGLGHKVFFVQNFTDLDDKIQKKAKENQTSWSSIAKKYIKSFREMRTLVNVLPPDAEPKATEYVKEMCEYAEKLLENGVAYELKDGIYFNTNKVPYGRFKPAEQGVSRVEHSTDPLHFAIWKYKEDGLFLFRGRKGVPGWHLECSVMTEKLLGTRFHIHGGGSDLIYPHHENELAQHCGKNVELENESQAKIWVHNEMVNIKNEKMSKSVGNCLFLKDLVKNRFDGDIVRYLFLTHHYRTILNFSMEKYETAKRSILEIRAFYFKWIYKKNIEKKDLDLSVLYDDFNTPASIVLLHKLIKEKRVEELSNLLFILGFAMEPMSSLSLDQIEDLMNEYIGKRRLKDFELSDRVRKTLLDNFIAVEDELWFYV